MKASEGFGLNHPDNWSPHPVEVRSRAVGSPLPMGTGNQSPEQQAEGDSQRAARGPQQPRALGRALTAPPPDTGDELPTNMQRAVSAFRMALPFVQRLLPLLDGTIVTTVSNLLTPHPQTAKPAPAVNLAPIEDGLAELQTQHSDLSKMVVEQNTSLKRVEDQLEMVREATDRNTLEQQELMEDLKSVGGRVNTFALIALVLLAVSVAINVILYLHIQRVLP